MTAPLPEVDTSLTSDSGTQTEAAGVDPLQFTDMGSAMPSFSIASADKAKMLNVSFEYAVSAAFASGDSSDVRVWIYDVTNSTLIPVTPTQFKAAQDIPGNLTDSFSRQVTQLLIA